MSLIEKRAGYKNKQGAKGEKAAIRYLRFHGYRIKARDVWYPFGEIDIVATKANNISFIEVKTRAIEKGDISRRPADAVNYYKRKRIINAAKAYLKSNPSERHPTLDIIEVYLDPKTSKKYKIVHIPSAFDETGK